MPPLTHTFELRVRPVAAPNGLPAQILRFCLLPHGRIADTDLPPDGDSDLPWSIPDPALTRRDKNSAGASASGPEPSGERTDPPRFWLPAYGTRLELQGLPERLAALFSTRRHLALQPSVGSGSAGMHQPALILAGAAPHFSSPPASTATLRCYEGVRALWDEAPLESPDHVQRDVDTHRASKLSLLQILEAWRSPGTLVDYSQIGPAELLACLSNLVFEFDLGQEADEILVQLHNAKPTLTAFLPETSYPEKLLWPTSAPSSPPQFCPIAVIAPSARRAGRSTEPLNVAVSQTADGIFFELLDPSGKREFPWLRNDSGPAADSTPCALDTCKLLLGRSRGPLPNDEPAIVATTYLDIGRFRSAEADGAIQNLGLPPIRVVDRLTPDAFVNEQLHYRLQIVDQFGDPLAAVSIAILRERFDPPPAPSEPVARFRQGPDASQLTIEARFPGLEQQLAPHLRAPRPDPQTRALDERVRQALASTFAPELFVQERPLDECGFYGDDDDLALLEGLREADGTFDPGAVADASSPLRNSPLENQLQGRFDREGLEAVSVDAPGTRWEWTWEPATTAKESPSANSAPAGELRLTIVIPVDSVGPGPAWFKQHRGYHFYLGLRRNEIANQAVRSALNLCRHELLLGLANDAVKLGVFQIERCDLPSLAHPSIEAPLRFLHPEHFHLVLLERQRPATPKTPPTLTPRYRADDLRERGVQELPLGVQLVYAHPVLGSRDFADAIVTTNGDPVLPIGGVRVLVRDQAASEQRLPFRLADTIQALPRLVAVYRPLQIEAGLEAIALPPSSPLALGPELPADYWNRLPDPSLARSPKIDSLQKEAIAVLAPGGLCDRLESAVQALTTGRNSRWRRRTSNSDTAANPAMPATPAVPLPEQLDALAAQDPSDWAAYLRQWAQLFAAAPAETREVVRSRFVEAAGPKLEQTWKNWLAAARQRLQLDESRLDAATLLTKDTSRPDQPRPDQPRVAQPAAALAWPLIGPLISVLREIGLAQDLVVRLAHADAPRTALSQSLAERLDPAQPTFAQRFPEIAFFGVQTADGRDTMATVRAVLMPYRGLLDALLGVPASPAEDVASQRLLLFEAVARGLQPGDGNRVLWLRDETRAPLNLPIREGRLVQYAWAGLHDYWHHDLEFAVQLLDRYHRLRDRYLRTLVERPAPRAPELVERHARHLTSAAQLAAEVTEEIHLPADLVPKVVRSLVAPRREPLDPHPGVVPAFFRPDYVIAFEVQDTEQRRNTTHNVLTRTRCGHVELQWALRTSFPEAAQASRSLRTFLDQHPSQSGPELARAWANARTTAIAQLASASASDKNPPTARRHVRRAAGIPDLAEPLLDWTTEPLPDGLTPLGDEEARQAIPPRPGSDVIACPGLPYFLQHRIECWHIADFLRSVPAHATATRLPLRLGLPVRPTYRFVAQDRRLEIRLVPPSLGDHLTPGETGTLARLSDRGILGTHLEVLPEAPRSEDSRASELGLATLPDLQLEYTFFLNLNPPGSALKLKPLMRWWLDASPGQNPEGDRPLGFRLEAIDPMATQLSPRHEDSLLVLLATVLDTALDPALSDLLSDRSSERVFLALRRGPLATDYLALAPK